MSWFTYKQPADAIIKMAAKLNGDEYIPHSILVDADGNPLGGKTYSAAITALAPAIAATDIFTLTGSATKTIRIISVQISGLATAAGAYSVVLLKRSTANSAGTSSAPTRVPHDSANDAATATPLAYTANPTTGTLVGIVRSVRATVTTAAGAIPNVPTWIEFGGGQPIVLRGITQVFAINLAGATMTGGAMDIDVSWTEV